MLMGHPPQIITCGRENIPQGCFEGLTPVQMLMVVQELVAYDAEVQKALADTLEAVQKIASCKFFGDHWHLCGGLLGEPQLFPLLVEFNHF